MMDMVDQNVYLYENNNNTFEYIPAQGAKGGESLRKEEIQVVMELMVMLEAKDKPEEVALELYGHLMIIQ